MTDRSRLTALLLAVLLLWSSPLMAAGGGGTPDEETSGDTMTWITLGIIVVVGGLLFIDVLSGSEGRPLEEGSTEPDTSIDTGIDWAAVFPADTIQLVLGVSPFPVPGGEEMSMALISSLVAEAGEGVTVYPDLVDLGTGPLLEMAAMASAYLGVDVLILGIPAGGEDFLLINVVMPDTVIWSGESEVGTETFGLARSILQSIDAD